MGLGNYLRRKIAAPIVGRLTLQSQMLAEAHVMHLLRSAPYAGRGRLEPHGFKSFSQNDEDGIIQEIFRRIGTQYGSFVEFGVQDGLQCNSRLLLYQGWRGLWIEGDAEACAKTRSHFRSELNDGRLQFRCESVTRGNINALIESAGFDGLDLLSIDIDGNDYWVWEAISAQPRVVVVEYNAKFRPPTRWIMAHNPVHRWDYSDYQGASLQSLAELGVAKGYTLVGCCLAGVNAFFVRDDLAQDNFATPDVAALYNPPRYYMQHFLASGHPARPFGPYVMR